MQQLRDAEEVQRLLNRAAEQLSQISQVHETDQDAWFLEFHGGGGFALEWLGESARLVLSAELGVPTPEAEVAALNLALSYNALWRDIGDLRIARDGDEGELLLIGELGPDDAEPEAFHAALLHFESLRRWWTEAITQGAAKGAAPSTDQALLLGRV